MKICVITPRFDNAGVSLAQIRLARAFVDCGHEVDVIFGYVDPDQVIPQVVGAKMFFWNHSRTIGMFISVLKYLKSADPAIVFSAEDHLNTIVLLAAILSGSSAKISGSARVSPISFKTFTGRILSKKWLLKILVRSLMWRANALTCVSKDMVKQYHSIFQNSKHIDVYNIIDDRTSRLRMLEPADHEWFKNKNVPVVVAAGTLSKRKGFDTLLLAFKKVVQKREVRLLILGEGYLRPELERMIDVLDLNSSVCLQGFVVNPLSYFTYCDVFVLASLAEGLPNVLVEAMMCGCTPVSTDCPTGPSEVLKLGRYGYLVPMSDPDAMAIGIERALDRPISKELLAEAIRPFEERAVLERHFQILGLSDSLLKN
jgi:glycosyltransferase involved in cell wall biosynthesis